MTASLCFVEPCTAHLPIVSHPKHYFNLLSTVQLKYIHHFGNDETKCTPLITINIKLQFPIMASNRQMRIVSSLKKKKVILPLARGHRKQPSSPPPTHQTGPLADSLLVHKPECWVPILPALHPLFCSLAFDLWKHTSCMNKDAKQTRYFYFSAPPIVSDAPCPISLCVSFNSSDSFGYYIC